jgi:hypothetical protein
MTVRQYSDLIEGEVVAEHQYSSDDPRDLIGVVRLILHNCSDFIKQEDLALHQDAIQLEKMEFTYPGVAGRLEVLRR